MLSSSSRMKFPDGINTSSPLFTINTITFSDDTLSRSFSIIPFKLLSPVISNSSILALFEKILSTLTALGNFSLFIILLAASSSGFIIIDIPNPSLTNLVFAVYSGFLTLAMVYFAPIFWAMIQEIIFSSSASVTAIKTSALSAPASIRFS